MVGRTQPEATPPPPPPPREEVVVIMEEEPPSAAAVDGWRVEMGKMAGDHPAAEEVPVTMEGDYPAAEETLPGAEEEPATA
jgi:hypothetical protein